MAMLETTKTPHISVLLEESIAALAIKSSGVYMDGTFGRGGHSKHILNELSAEATLVAVDRDLSAIEYGKQHFAGERRLHLVHSDFASIQQKVLEQELPEKFDGILFDLGVSSPQLDEPNRGFSFMQDGPLDMRMDTSCGQTAAQWLSSAEEKEIANVIFQLGEEKLSRRIARAIVEQREEQPFTRTSQLVDLLEDVIKRKEKNKHPATRTFLALRMYLNDELGQIEAMLPQAVKMLNPGGRLAIISFHSREDRIVKQFFRDISKGPKLPKRLPIQEEYQAPVKLIGKAIKPTEQEVRLNPRSRSAVLRVGERTEVPYV